MASQAKRTRKDTAGVKDNAYANLTEEIKEEPLNPEDPRFILGDMSMVSASEIEDPLFMASLKAACSVNLVQIPSDPSVAAELTSEYVIKDEPSDEEKDSDCDVDNSNSEDSEKEPEDDTAAAADADPVVWTTDSSSMTTLPFIKQHSLLVPLPNEPYDIFRMFIDDEFIDMVACETNAYGKKQVRDLWKSVTRQEMLTFFGLLIHTGTIRLDRLSDYWKRHYLFNITGFSTFMSRTRFLQILMCLSFSSASNEQNRLAKIQPVVDHFNNKMKDIYYPGANLTVTESMTFQGSRILVEKKGKTHKNKAKVTCLHVLAEPSGMVLKLKVSHGPVDNEELVLDLLDEKLNCGHTVYLGEQYNSVKLATALLERQTHCTGSLDRSIKSVAWMLKKLKLIQPERPSKLSYYQNGVHVCKVKKTFYLSTQHDEEMIHVPTKAGRVVVKSKLVAMYRSVMEEDIQDELMAFYPCQANKLKWYKKIFVHVLQQAIINAYHLNAKFKDPKKCFYNFRLDVLMKLLPDVAVSTDCATSELHVLTKIEKVRFRERHERGRVSVRKEVVRKECKGCKQAKRRTATTFECRQCEGSPGYCLECFCRLHAITTEELDERLCSNNLPLSNTR